MSPQELTADGLIIVKSKAAFDAAIAENGNARRRLIPRNWKIVGGFVLAAALVVIAISIARAAERTGGYEIVAYRSGKDLREDRPNIIPLPDSRHDTRELCRHAIQFVRVQQSGMRLRCDKIDDRRVR